MRETVLQLNSSYLENERSIWICEPESVSGASDLVVFLDAEHYRNRIDALSVIEELRGQVADSRYVFVSHQTWETRWRECPCYPPFAGFIGDALLAQGYAVRYQEFDGGHHYACWNRTLVDALKWGVSLQPAE